MRTRAALAPLAAFVFVLLGVYAYRPNGVGSTYAFTALTLCPVVAWMAAAAAFAEPLTQQQVAMAAAGGRRRALLGRVLALGGVGALLAALDVALPAIFGLFDRTPALADLAAAALAHLACAALGVALGLLATPPAARRPPAAFMVIVRLRGARGAAVRPRAGAVARRLAGRHPQRRRAAHAGQRGRARRAGRPGPGGAGTGRRRRAAPARGMTTVAIDAREARAEQPRGRGRYARELIAALGRLGVYDVREEVGGLGPEVLWEQVGWPRRLARHPPDLVHAPGGLLPLRRPCPGLVSVHDLAFEVHDDLAPRAAWRYRRFVPRSARSAELTLCASAYTAADVAERYDVDPDRLRVVPHAPALASGDAPLPDGGPYLLAVGDHRPSRNLDRLVAAFAALRAGELPDHRLVLAGAGDSGLATGTPS